VIKPIWALAGVALLGVTGAAGAVIVASPGGEEEVVQQVETATPTTRGAKDPNFKPTAMLEATPSPQETPPPHTPPVACRSEEPTGHKLFRWADVIVQLPLDDSVRAFGSVSNEYSGPTLTIYHSSSGGDTYINATTGAIVEQSYIDDVTGASVPIVRLPNPEVDAVLATVSICPFSRNTAPWPYNGEPPPSPPKTHGKLRYLEPDGTTGIQVLASEMINDPGGCIDMLSVESAESVAWTDAGTGETWWSRIAEKDREAFDRYLSSIQIGEADSPPCS
jgi:hypothetical protein